MGTITRNAANNFTTGGVILPAGINDTSVASITELENTAAGGAMTLISEQTASDSASISFTTGIDSTYPIYKFEFINIHPATNAVSFTFNGSTDAGSNYNVIKTTTFFHSYQNEAGTDSGLGYQPNQDLAQSTSFQQISKSTGNGADESASGTLTLFNPSSTTYVKHFISNSSEYSGANENFNDFLAGYFNTTSAVNAIRFQMSSGNIDDGTIKLYGISGS
jgi:hypothetical protein